MMTSRRIQIQFLMEQLKAEHDHMRHIQAQLTDDNYRTVSMDAANVAYSIDSLTVELERLNEAN